MAIAVQAQFAVLVPSSSVLGTFEVRSLQETLSDSVENMGFALRRSWVLTLILLHPCPYL